MSNKNFKYIYPVPHTYNESIDITDVLIKIGVPLDKRNNLCCPNNHEGLHKLKIHNDTNRCHCHNCGDFNKSVVDVAVWYKKGNFIEAIKWLSEEFGISKVLNPDYENNGIKLTEEQKAFANAALHKIQISKPCELNEALKVKTKSMEIKYMDFDSNKAFTKINIDDLNKYLPYSKLWEKMNDEQKLKVVYSYFYNYTLKENQKPKLMYYKKRSIDLKNQWLNKISYIKTDKFEDLLIELTNIFPLDILEKVGLIKYKEDKKEYKLSFDYIKKGGVLIVPSFSLYDNLCTGFMLRPTHPEQWMIDKHMKEIQLSNTKIVYPLPFGVTNETLKGFDTFCLTEGHPDGLSIPGNTNDNDKVAFMSIAGVNGLNTEHIGLFKNKKILLYLDQDDAGLKSAFGYKEINSSEGREIFINEIQEDEYNLTCKRLTLNKINFNTVNYEGLKSKFNKLHIECVNKVWDKKFGSDLNEVRINGNISLIFKNSY